MFFQTAQYAVIAFRNGPKRDWLVISYPTEKILRDLIAAPSIVTLGYSSREEALANVGRQSSTAAVAGHDSNAGRVDIGRTVLKEVRTATRRLLLIRAGHTNCF